jgi:hypothetical protein
VVSDAKQYCSFGKSAAIRRAEALATADSCGLQLAGIATGSLAIFAAIRRASSTALGNSPLLSSGKIQSFV